MTEDDLLHLRNFGDKSLQELKEKLAERGAHRPLRQRARPRLGAR